MKYFFILGTNPTLSIAEICAVFPQASEGRIINKNVFVLEMLEIDAGEVIKKLGGIIKIGTITGGTPTKDVEKFPPKADPPQAEKITNYKELKNKIAELINIDKIKGKFNFGFSYYGKGGINFKTLGMETKKYLRERGISCRWVTSREPVLSSVVVEQNKLIQEGRGIEIILVGDNEKLLIGKTLAVQPFKELSFRDYGRPARDDRSGMLPPKLAQIMINLATSGSTALKAVEPLLLDPFCGSGTILTEAMLMGHKNIIGADISQKAIEDTRKNIEWTEKKFQVTSSKLQVFNKNAAELSKFIKPNSIDAIVTEPYLGPQRGKHDIQKTIKELENLYSKALLEFYKILKPSGRIAMVWPVFRVSHNAYRVSPNLNGLKIINPIPEYLRSNKIIELTARNIIIYGREGQGVWREIVVLEK